MCPRGSQHLVPMRPSQAHTLEFHFEAEMMHFELKWGVEAPPAAEALVTELSGASHLGAIKGTDLWRSSLKVPSW